MKDINTTKDAFNSATASKIQAEYDTLVAVRRINGETAAILESISNMAEQRQMDDIQLLLQQVYVFTRKCCSRINNDALHFQEFVSKYFIQKTFLYKSVIRVE